MWNSHNDNDILDFALLWAPLGGPAPENVAAAFSIDFGEYTSRLRGAAKCYLSQLLQVVTTPERIYGPSHLQRLIDGPRKNMSSDVAGSSDNSSRTT